VKYIIVELCICWCRNNLKIIYNAWTEQYETDLNKRFNLNLLSLNFDKNISINSKRGIPGIWIWTLNMTRDLLPICLIPTSLNNYWQHVILVQPVTLLRVQNRSWLEKHQWWSTTLTFIWLWIMASFYGVTLHILQIFSDYPPPPQKKKNCYKY
jgi:hypothetical protein